MKKKSKSGGQLPANAQIVSAKGYQKNGKTISIVKYRINNETFIAWIPGGGAA